MFGCLWMGKNILVDFKQISSVTNAFLAEMS